MNSSPKLQGLKSVADFAKAKGEIKSRIEYLEEKIALLHRRLVDVQFEPSSSSDRAALREEVRRYEDEIQDLDAAALGIGPREAAAEQAERALAARQPEAKAHQKRLHSLYLEQHKHLLALGPIIKEIREVGQQLDALNRVFAEAGRSDLRLEHPLSMLRRLTGRANTDVITQLPFYEPPHADGPLLARMHEVKL